MANNISAEQIEKAKLEWLTHKRLIEYDTHDFTTVKLKELWNSGDIELTEIEKQIWNKKSNYVWLYSRYMPRIIENLLLGIPLPMIYLSKKDDKYAIVEGIYLIYSIMLFMNNHFELNNLTRLKSLTAFSYATLPNCIKARLHKRCIRTIILNDIPGYKMKSSGKIPLVEMKKI